MVFVRSALVAAVLAAVPAWAAAQAQAPPSAGSGQASLPPAMVCGQQAIPRAQPPAGSGPVILFIAPCFEAQGGTSVIEPQTYLYYIQLKASVPSQAQWVPWNDASEKMVLDDFRRLWSTNFLDNLWIDVKDYQFPNGTVGKIVTYNMEERQRVKIVDYVGSKKLETTKIDEKLKEANAQIRLDTFIDAGLVRKVAGIVTDMLREKGFQFASVKPEITAIPGGPKLVHLTFHMDEGPKVKIRSVDFAGNQAMSDG
jgi:outer membrane protein insertion porin family